MKRSITARKKELLEFIKYKLGSRYDEYVKDYRLDKISYAKLREWAIRYDIID